MKREDKEKFRKKSNEELEKNLFELKKELMGKEGNVRSSQSNRMAYSQDTPINLKNTRKNIAVIKTILSERRMIKC